MTFSLRGYTPLGDIITTIQMQTDDGSDCFGDWIRVTTEQLLVFDNYGELQTVYENVPIINALIIDKKLLYCLVDIA